MTLRARLVLAAGLIVVVVVTGGLLIVGSQERYLVDQVDQQLGATRPLFRPGPGGGPGVGPPGGGTGPDAPVSDLFVAVVDGEELVTVLRGQLLDDVPDLDVESVVAGDGRDRGPFTVGGAATDLRFRVLVVSEPLFDEVAVIALPLDEVDGAVAQLRTVLVVGGAAIVLILALAVWWVERLGLRPVARVTAVADAIAGGARGLRVDDAGRGTEADRLAAAFNVMLDERDATEDRLRRFISDASHELRTPLTSIRGYLDLYRSGGFRGEGELDDAVRRMGRETGRMQRLVEDLLLLARLDEHPPMRTEVVDLGRLLDDAATDARVLQPERPISVDVGATPVEVVGDPFRLQQVVGILVANALAHTDRHVDLRLSAEPGGPIATVVVADAGPGMEPADAERAFDRFHRGDRSRTRSTGGAGLGLSIARSIVEAHGGEIGLATAPGQGCTFTVRLPSPDAGSGTTP